MVAARAADADDPPLDRAVAAWTRGDARALARTSCTTPTRSPRSPTRGCGCYDEDGPIGELEVAVAETLARWRVGSIELPDYYLVLDARDVGCRRAGTGTSGCCTRPHRRAWCRCPIPMPPRARSRAWARERGGRISTTCSTGIERVVPDQLCSSSAGASARIE